VCLALLNAVHYVHATPVLADIDPTTQNMDPDDVKKRLTRRTKAIIVPHMFGLAANLESLLTLGVPIIEDCAQAVGTTYNGRTVGAFGHVAVFSFYATKVITTGEGGMVLSNSQDILHRVRDLRECDQKDDPGVRYNYKMTDMQAALGIAQLGQLDGFIKARRSIAQRYTEAFSTLPVVLPPRDDGHIYYRYVVRVEDDARPVIDRLSQKRIQCAQPVYKPLHSYLGNANCPKTEEVWIQSVSIPIYPSLSEKDVDEVADSVTETLRGAM
jgi:dTDP-4-amino-4,6-dideoxygalactose transaminase